MADPEVSFAGSRWRSALPIAVLVVGVLALYAHSLSNPFIWDDPLQITQNRAVTDGIPLADYFLDPSSTSTVEDYNARIYRPLRNLAWRGLYLLAGPNPAAFHLANVLLYAFAATLIFRLCRALFGNVEVALGASCIWAVLPVHVEAVCFASAFGDQLSLVFELAAISCGLAALRPGKQVRAIVLSAALMAAALLAKEMAVTGVLLIGLVAWRLGHRGRRLMWLLGVHALVLVSYLALRTAVIGRVGQETTTAATLLTGLREAPVLLVHYAWVTIAPLGHNTSYFVEQPGTGVFLLYLFGLVAFFAGLVVIDRRRLRPPGSLLGAAWFAVALLPVLHIVPIWAHVADRFALLPSVGVALLAAWALDLVEPARRVRMTALVVTPVVLLYAGATLLEQRPWRSELALWLHATEESPLSGMAYQNLARVHLEAGRYEKTLEALSKAISPGADVPAELWVWRAMALERLGRLDEAGAAAEQAVRRVAKPAYAYALLGSIRHQAGDSAAARAALEQARRHDAHHLSVRLLEAELLTADGRRQEAFAVYAAIVSQSPDVARFRYLAAEAALAAGDPQAARAQGEACLRLAPEEPRCRSVLDRLDTAAESPATK